MTTRDHSSKVWSILELVLGAVILVCAIALGLWMVTAPDRPTFRFDSDPLIARDPKSSQLLGAQTIGAITSLFVTGILIVVHAAYYLLRRQRIVHHPAGAALPVEAGVARPAVPRLLTILPGVGYRSFVAWRYLLVFHHKIKTHTKIIILSLVGVRIAMWLVLDVGARDTDLLGTIGSLIVLAAIAVWFWGVLRHSKLATIVFIFGEVLVFVGFGIAGLAGMGKLPIDAPTARLIQQVFGIVSIIGGLLAFLAGFFGTLRGFFTFFTTVPVGGVWIGTSALVVVLAVMSGFESDLRDKILGSNAHIQVTKEDGEFVEWKQVKAKIDKIPGVVASTPYAVSEVVIAANNNGMPVIIKGIDPDSVGKVTDLVADLDDKDAMRRLEPLIDLGHDRTVEPTLQPTDVDPPPPDMVTGGDPIDFSGDGDGDAGSGSGSGSAAPEPPAPDAGSAGGSDIEPEPLDPDNLPISPYGGDAVRIVGTDAEAEVLDWLDSDLIRWMVGDDDVDPGIHVVDVGSDPTLSRRTQALPGILVGKELVKQTHLYTGEEVRVVSPLSDPSNPDATGTPIPFNRDYRVAGVFYTGMYEYDLKFVYVTLSSLQDFLDLGDTVDGIEVRVASADDTDRYVSHGDDAGLINQALGSGYRVQDWREINRSLFSALKLEKIAMFLVLGIVILVASFSIIGNLIMVVVEKGREIALLKTLGASDTGVMQMFAVQGLIIGLIGTTLGVGMGLIGCVVMEKFGLPLNPDVYYIDRLPIHVDPQSVLAAAVTGVAISIGATLYPALLAARVRPAAGMRH